MLGATLPRAQECYGVRVAEPSPPGINSIYHCGLALLVALRCRTYATLIGEEIAASGPQLPAPPSHMLEVETHPGPWTPVTEDDRRAVLTELERILASPLFGHSKRYPNLLRYLVEQAVEGNEDRLKERLLGASVFHRPPDYDTNQDTVVRLAAAEVRKRIAQFYHEAGPPAEIEIALRPGSYIPVFRRVEAVVSELADLPEAIADPSVTAPPPAPAAGASRTLRAAIGSHRWLLFAGVAALLVLAAVSGFFWLARKNALAADRQLWTPILNEPGQVRLVIADLSAGLNYHPEIVARQPDRLFSLLRMGEIVNYRDSIALSDIVAFLARNQKPYTLALSTQATYPDLQSGASILIGGLDNVWTMRVTEPLRYRFVHRPTPYVYAIEDRQHPGRDDWRLDFSQSSDRTSQEFAIVARIFDQTTGRPVLVAAGLGANGTAAAAEFLLDPARTAELAAYAPRNWQRLNMEAVIRTQILDNHAGPPHLVASAFW